MPRQRNTRSTTIYFLVDVRPETVSSGWPDGKPFYCGKTVMRVERRLRNHFATTAKWPKRKLSLAMVEIGSSVILRAVEVVSADGDWIERERHWISELKKINPECSNTAIGGQGAPGYVPTAEHRAKLRVSSTGRKHTPEALAKMRRPRQPKQWVFTDEHREKLRQANQTSPAAVAQRAKLHASLKGKKFSPEHRAKLSAARKNSPKAMAAALANLKAIQSRRSTAA